MDYATMIAAMFGRNFPMPVRMADPNRVSKHALGRTVKGTVPPRNFIHSNPDTRVATAPRQRSGKTWKI